MERIGAHRKFCRIMATFSNAVSVILMAVMMMFMARSVGMIPARIKGGAINSVSFTSIGIDMTEFLVFGVLALIVAMIFHEFAHGIQSRANDVGVESSGLIYAVVPLGAFVEMNEEDSKKATLKEKMSIYSAGISINFIVAAISFLLFAMLMLAPLGNVAGVNDDSVGLYSVDKGSPAYSAGLSAGSIILTVDGKEVHLDSDGLSYGLIQDGKVLGGGSYPIEYLTPDGRVTKDIWLGVFVKKVVTDSPANIARLPEGSLLISIDGTPITGTESFTEFLAGTIPGDEVEVTFVNVTTGVEDKINITLGGTEIGYMGVQTNYSGMVFITPGFVHGKAINPIYGETAITGMLDSALKYPFLLMEGFSPVPDEFQWWFDAPGGNIFWIFCALIYWMFWVNLLLGITNALPLMPFDGGFLFRGWMLQILEKMNYKDEEVREKVANNISNAVSGFMAFLLILIVFAVLFPTT